MNSQPKWRLAVLFALVSVLVVVAGPHAVQGGEVLPTNTWVDFYSSSSVYLGAPVPVGALIAVFDPQEVQCGAFTVTTAGMYGIMPCYGDDPTTPQDEGASLGDALHFTINGQAALAEAISINGTPASPGTVVVWAPAQSLWQVDLRVDAEGDTPTPTSTATATATSSATPTSTATPSATHTETPTRTPTAIASSTATATSTATAAATNTETPTRTPTATASSTATATSTGTATTTASATPTSTATATSTATTTATPASTATTTVTPTSSSTPTATDTPTPTRTPTTTHTPTPAPDRFWIPLILK